MPAITQKEKDNILRWDGQSRGHYEVYYLKWNDAASRTAYWIRYTLTSPLPGVMDPYCEMWGIFFDVADPSKNFAVKNRFPIGRLSFAKDRHHVRIADGELTQTSCRADLTDPQTGHRLAWDLTFDSDTPTLYHFPGEYFYRAKFPTTKVLCPHLNARFNGAITANGREINLTDAPGQQTHLWGSKHAWRWAWGHCNTFAEDPTAIWEGIDSQIKLGPILSPHFKLFYLRAGGKEYFANAPHQWLGNKSSWELGRWSFEFRHADGRVRGEVKNRFEEFVAVTYMDPNGKNLWCNNSKVAKIKLELFDQSGKQTGELNSEHGSALEFVDRVTYPQVPVRI